MDTVIPALETWFQELLDDANAIENLALRTEEIADLGTPEAFIANLKSPIRHTHPYGYTTQPSTSLPNPIEIPRNLRTDC